MSKMIREKQGATIIQDKYVLYMCIILFIAEAVAGGWIYYLSFLPVGSGDSAFVILMSRLFGIFSALHLPVIILINPNRFIVWLRFTNESIEYHTIARKKELVPYEEYPYILHGKYLHFVYWRHYIVFSNRRLKDSELSAINDVSPSAKLIKIHCTPKVCKELIAALPPRRKSEVMAIATIVENAVKEERGFLTSNKRSKHRKK